MPMKQLSASFSLTDKINRYTNEYETLLYPLGLWLMTFMVAIVISQAFHEMIGSVNPNGVGFQSWDGLFFLRIAANGYSDLSSTAFFPLLPILINLFNKITHWPLNICGFLITNFAFLCALIFLYKLSLIRTQNKAVSRRVLWLITFFPTAMFFNAVYSESLTLLTTVIFFYSIEQGRWFTAMISGFFAAAAHTLGVLLIFAGLCYLWRMRHQLKFKIVILRFLSLGIVALGLFLYMLYLQWRFGHALDFLLAEKNWHRQVVIPLVNIIQQFINYILHHPHGLTSWIFVNTVNGFCALWMTLIGILMVTVYRHDQTITLEMKVFFLLTLFFSISSGPFYGSIMSYGRFMVVLFPGFILWAKKMHHSILLLLILSLMLTIKILFQGLFVCGYSVV